MYIYAHTYYMYVQVLCRYVYTKINMYTYVNMYESASTSDNSCEKSSVGCQNLPVFDCI